MKKRILLIITGSIAAYKSLYLIRLLKDAGFDLNCITTRSAEKFITHLTVSSLTGNKVYNDLFSLDDELEMGHIKLAKENTGFQKIFLDEAHKRILKSNANLYIDLSGIAKGFSMDKIALYLNKKGFKNYLIEVGGELLAKGVNADNKVWQIGIESPNNNDNTIEDIVQLNNMAMATSGDYKKYFEKDNIRYSHIIDPETGKPIKHKLVSVTVLDYSAMNADALATAFSVLGPEKTLLLAKKLKVPVYLIIKNDGHFEKKYNDYFVPFLSN